MESFLPQTFKDYAEIIKDYTDLFFLIGGACTVWLFLVWLVNLVGKRKYKVALKALHELKLCQYATLGELEVMYYCSSPNKSYKQEFLEREGILEGQWDKLTWAFYPFGLFRSYSDFGNYIFYIKLMALSRKRSSIFSEYRHYFSRTHPKGRADLEKKKKELYIEWEDIISSMEKIIEKEMKEGKVGIKDWWKVFTFKRNKIYH